MNTQDYITLLLSSITYRSNKGYTYLKHDMLSNAVNIDDIIKILESKAFKVIKLDEGTLVISWSSIAW